MIGDVFIVFEIRSKKEFAALRRYSEVGLVGRGRLNTDCLVTRV